MKKPDFDNDLTLASTVLQEFQFRHDHYWKLIYQAVLTHTALLAGAFFLFQSMQGSARLLAVFPTFTALLFGHVSSLLMQAEGARFRGPARLFRELLLKHLDDTQEERYLINKWPEADFKVNVPVPFLEPFTTDYKVAAKSELSVLIPVWWRLYAIVSPILVLIALLFAK